MGTVILDTRIFKCFISNSSGLPQIKQFNTDQGISKQHSFNLKKRKSGKELETFLLHMQGVVKESIYNEKKEDKRT